MLEDIIRQYLGLFPNEAKGLNLLIKQVAEEQELSNRRNYEGHITGSGIVLSPDRAKVLLIYHPTFKRWQQPGGHWEPQEKGPWLAAKRETEEETGVKIGKAIALKNEFVPLQIDSHIVPNLPPKYEPQHYHHDFSYGFIADNEDLNMGDKVIKEARWVNIGELEERPLKISVLRLLEALKG